MQNRILVFMQKYRDALLGAATPTDDDTPSLSQGWLPAVYFVLSIGLYALYMILMQSDWVLSGEMWAEMATIYYPTAAANSWIEKLFATDAGYIPLPQRLLATLGWLIGLSAKTLPYFYTWSAILLSGTIVGSFCLRPFRALLASDLFRFLISLTVLLLADFESRTFINFTYFCGFFACILTALALVQRSKAVPAWAWLLPIAMMSKPAVLAALPALLIAAPLGGRRFQRIVAVCIVVVIVQLARLYLSAAAGIAAQLAPPAGFTLVHKLGAALLYSVGLLGVFSSAQQGSPTILRPLLLGLAILLLATWVMYRRRTPANALLLAGASLLLFNMLLNSFALTFFWNINLDKLTVIPVFRHTIVALSGIVLMIAALLAAVFGRSLAGAGPVVFAAWIALSGWLGLSTHFNRAPDSPLLFNSHWQALASAIETSEVACVPIDPLGLVFGRHCALLNPDMNFVRTLQFQALSDVAIPTEATAAPPPSVRDKTLHAFAILVRPQAPRTVQVQGTAVIQHRDGQKRVLHGERTLHASGGLVLFTCPVGIAAADIDTVAFHFDQSLQIGFTADRPQRDPVVLWMGN